MFIPSPQTDGYHMSPDTPRPPVLLPTGVSQQTGASVYTTPGQVLGQTLTNCRSGKEAVSKVEG